MPFLTPLRAQDYPGEGQSSETLPFASQRNGARGGGIGRWGDREKAEGVLHPPTCQQKLGDRATRIS